MQNGRTDNMVTGVLPTYVGPDELRYTHNKALIFPAGNRISQVRNSQYTLC